MLACRRTEHRGKLETLVQQSHAARKRSGSREMEGPETKLILVCDERRGTGSDYHEKTGKACTKGQVFNSQYREKGAKTVAKIESCVTYLFCVI
jgi:hypothetical protein